MAVMRFTISEDGERIPIAEHITAQQGSQQTNEPAAKAAGKQKESAYMLARTTAELWGKPLVFFAGEFWSFDKLAGWVVCSNAVGDLANRVAQSNSEKTVLPIMRSHLSLPVENSCESVYWRRVGSLWEFTWSQLTLTENQLLFSDMIYDLMDDSAESLDGQVVFGPSITLPYDGEVKRCEEFESMVARQFPDIEERMHLQEVLSTVLQPHVMLRGQIVLYGAPYSRKTTLLSAVAACPNGRAGVSQAQESELVRDKWITNILVGKFANVSDDSKVLENWVYWQKRYTSGNMTVEPKYGKPMSVTPTAKLLSSCNEIQSLADSSGAAADRLFLFELTHSFEKVHGSSNDERMSVRYWSATPRRLGILTWLLEGLVRLRKRGRFEPPTSWLSKLERAKGEADPLCLQIADLYREGTDEDFVATEDIVAALNLPNDISNQMRVARYIARMFPKAEKIRKMHNSVRRIGYTRLTNN